MSWADVVQRHIDNAGAKYDEGEKGEALVWLLAATQGLLNELEKRDLGA